MSDELREAAQRVTGYVRARQLMSNTDPEEISEIVIMPAGAEEPMPFRLLSSDLEALVAHALGTVDETGEMTVVPARILRQLHKSAAELYALHRAGVDNWTGYAEAMQQ